MKFNRMILGFCLTVLLFSAAALAGNVTPQHFYADAAPFLDNYAITTNYVLAADFEIDMVVKKSRQILASKEYQACMKTGRMDSKACASIKIPSLVFAKEEMPPEAAEMISDMKTFVQLMSDDEEKRYLPAFQNALNFLGDSFDQSLEELSVFIKQNSSSEVLTLVKGCPDPASVSSTVSSDCEFRKNVEFTDNEVRVAIKNAKKSNLHAASLAKAQLRKELGI